MSPRLTSHALVFTLATAFIAPMGRAQEQLASALTSNAERPVFRSAVELVALNVTVLDQGKRFVSDLGRGDFAVYENGIRQELSFFGMADVPIEVALLLDLSSSMADATALLREAAIRFLQTLRPHDRATVIGFADRLWVLQPFTDDVGQLERAVQEVRADGNTALYDAIYITLKELERERKGRADVRRQVVIVLSDGHDTSSRLGTDEAVAAARRGDAVIYTIALRRQPISRGEINVSVFEQEFTLRALAQDSGGRMFSADRAEQLTGVYDAIAAEIAHQYVLAFVPARRPADAGFRQLNVRVAHVRAAEVRTRRGYYAGRAG